MRNDTVSLIQPSRRSARLQEKDPTQSFHERFLFQRKKTKSDRRIRPSRKEGTELSTHGDQVSDVIPLRESMVHVWIKDTFGKWSREEANLMAA